MKNSIGILAFCMSLMVCCKKEQEDQRLPVFFPGDQITGFLKTERNGEAEEGTAYARFHDENPGLLGITVNTFSEAGAIRESISFNKIPIKIGKHPIKGPYDKNINGLIGSTYGIWGSDGDLLEAIYDSDDEAGGLLELTKIDTSSKEIQGTFTRAGFILNMASGPEFPQKVTFRNATFSMKIIN